MNMGYKAVIFDLDGTLLDTLEDIGDRVNEVLESNGFPKRTYDEIKSFVGNGGRKLVERSLPEGLSEDKVDEIVKSYGEHCRKIYRVKAEPYDGIVDMLRSLKENGIKTGVASNKGNLNVNRLCDDFFEGLIDFAIGSGLGFEPKPNPEMVYECIRQLGVEVQDCIFVGDSESDTRTAKKVGIKCIGVLCKYTLKVSKLMFVDDAHQHLQIGMRVYCEFRRGNFRYSKRHLTDC